jgi:hypothetical protein
MDELIHIFMHLLHMLKFHTVLIGILEFEVLAVRLDLALAKGDMLTVAGI